MPGVLIIDSGGANIASLQFALQRLGAESSVSADAGRIRNAGHVILPGVGAAADAMSRLRRYNLDGVIPNLHQPVLREARELFFLPAEEVRLQDHRDA